MVSAVPGHENVVVGMGAAHGFKFAPTLGRLLADVLLDDRSGVDLAPFRFDRPGITDPSYTPHWLV